MRKKIAYVISEKYQNTPKEYEIHPKTCISRKNGDSNPGMKLKDGKEIAATKSTLFAVRKSLKSVSETFERIYDQIGI